MNIKNVFKLFILQLYWLHWLSWSWFFLSGYALRLIYTISGCKLNVVRLRVVALCSRVFL
jgi:hypothetical protein